MTGSDAHRFSYPHTRASDPDTSWEAGAAASTSEVGRRRVFTAATYLRSFTDADLTGWINARYSDGMHAGSVAKRRLDLERAGKIVRTADRRLVDGRNRVVFRVAA